MFRENQICVDIAVVSQAIKRETVRSRCDVARWWSRQQAATPSAVLSVFHVAKWLLNGQIRVRGCSREALSRRMLHAVATTEVRSR